MTQYHEPVLLQSVCTWLNVTAGGKYIDATIGGGGHTLEILKRGGQVLGIDQDQDAIDYLSTQSPFLPALDSGQLILVRSNFSHLTEVAAQHNWSPVSGIIFDLGVSWHQLSTATRGFSFKLSGPLDMRMDERLIPTAATLVNTLSVKQLTQILMEFGELNNGRILAQKIISARPITDTFQLAAVIGPPDSRKQRVFQALRIAVNSEIFSLQAGLSAALPVLSNRGRVLVISFHSLEDALVKNQFKNWSHDHLGHMLTHKPITPSPEEIRINPKSHSAKLRIFEKY